MKMRTICTTVFLLACLPALMGAAVYRWIDENGVVNYGQQKPANFPAERIFDGRPVAPQQAEEAQSQQAETEPPVPLASSSLSSVQQEALEGLQAAEQARQLEIARVRQANCERANQLLSDLTSRGRIRVSDAAGNQRVMDEDERQARIAEAQQGIAENCFADGSG